jgi:hypothetical protein
VVEVALHALMEEGAAFPHAAAGGGVEESAALLVLVLPLKGHDGVHLALRDLLGGAGALGSLSSALGLPRSVTRSLRRGLDRGALLSLPGALV